MDAINPLLVDAGLSLPEGVLLDNRFRGMSAEQIYNLLETESDSDEGSGGEDQTPGCGAGNLTPVAPEQDDAPEEPLAPETDGGIGQVLDAPAADDEEPGAQEQSAAERRQATRSARIAQQSRRSTGDESRPRVHRRR